jgi:TRAP-type mannitol/chloroaromatic compound transport system permease large subunit
VKLRKELWFGFTLMAIIAVVVIALTPWAGLLDGHLSRQDLGVLGLLMLALIVFAIMLGFPTAFTLMGLGVFFAWLAYYSVNPDTALRQVLDLFVQRTYGVMRNDVLIAVPLFVFMGYLVERAALVDRLFRSLHLATVRLPGSLAVATIVTCAVFATATGIVGAVVTLMGLLAFPAMLKAGYNVKVAAGAVTAGGCLGILIPPSVLLIVYGATAGVSVVQLYAGAFFPGLMLAGLYIGYVVLLAKLKPALMPALSEEERRVPLPDHMHALAQRGKNALLVLARSLRGLPASGIPARTVASELLVSLIPLLAIAGLLYVIHRAATAPQLEPDVPEVAVAGLAAPAGAVEAGTGLAEAVEEAEKGSGAQEPGGARESAAAGLSEPAGAAQTPQQAQAAPAAEVPPGEKSRPAERSPAPGWFWTMAGIGAAALLLLYALWSWERLLIFKMLLTSFFPLAVLILAVLGSIMFGLATPTEAAALGALGGFLLAIAYRLTEHWRAAAADASRLAVLAGASKDLWGILKESSFLTARTTAMVCWLFVGSAIFSSAFALLGGQEIVERWVLSLDLTPLQFLILAQLIIFLLGWPLEWTEIIVIFMPIFIPLLPHFNIDPLFFGLLVALNLQTAFLSPPVAMAAYYLKGVSPPHVTLNQIFAGMIPFMGLQVIAMVLLYLFPGIGLWLPSVLYR